MILDLQTREFYKCLQTGSGIRSLGFAVSKKENILASFFDLPCCALSALVLYKVMTNTLCGHHDNLNKFGKENLIQLLRRTSGKL